MMKYLPRKSFLGLIICCVFAATYPTVLRAEGSKKGDPVSDPFWHRLFVFVGGDGGYHFLSSNDAAELSKHGYQIDAKGLLSYSWKDVTADVGGGWLFNSSVGHASSGTLLRDKVNMKAGFVRAAGRYRFTPRWELGLLNHVLFLADTRFQTTQPISNHVNWLFGPEAVYRLPFDFPIQFSAAFLTDATISGRQLYQVLLGVQVGFPLMGPISTPTPVPTATPTPEATPTPPPTPTPPATPTPPPVPSPITVTVTVPVKTYSFDLQPIQFDFASARIRPKSMPMLKKLGAFLSEHSKGWEKLTVEGHTDRRGTAEYNMRLSRQRAESVRKVLIDEGVKESAVSAVGYGFTRPRVDKNTKEAWQKNRRVDFTLEGIKDPEPIDAFFRDLNREF
jgi:outer membrane protein OmpA-like peptidoglycan-associated protein